MVTTLAGSCLSKRLNLKSPLLNIFSSISSHFCWSRIWEFKKAETIRTCLMHSPIFMTDCYIHWMISMFIAPLGPMQQLASPPHLNNFEALLTLYFNGCSSNLMKYKPHWMKLNESKRAPLVLNESKHDLIRLEQKLIRAWLSSMEMNWAWLHLIAGMNVSIAWLVLIGLAWIWKDLFMYLFQLIVDLSQRCVGVEYFC